MVRTWNGGPPSIRRVIAAFAVVVLYGRTLVALEALTPTATVEEYKTAVATARTALAALVAVAGPFAGAQLDSLSTAQQQLEAAAGELGADATPAQAEEDLRPYLQDVTGEVVLTYNAICNPNPTPSSAS